MCTLFAAYDYHPDYRLIIAANRDEFYERPTERANFWHDNPEILAGRDLQQMGTWMGITTTGRFAALTNFRNPNEKLKDSQSRGHIVRDFLADESTPADFLTELKRKRNHYQGFNVLIGDDRSLMYYSNTGNEIKKLPPGLYGLSNHLLDTPWPKVEKGKAHLANLLAANNDVNEEDLFRLLADEELAPKEQLPDTGLNPDWEKQLSAIFIKTPAYGTRCSTVITIDKTETVTFTERIFPNPDKNERTFQFKIKRNG